MSTLTIPDVDDALRQKLQARALRNGHSVEAEARAILEQ